MLVRLAYGLLLRIFHGHFQVANQCDYTSRQLRYPQGGSMLLGAKRGLHAQKLYLRKQCGERVVELVLDERDGLPQLTT
jgi:hypothetical protein